jgi:4-amino-4-deoxy-L-arabinose transferase-like glycosyltransferase
MNLSARWQNGILLAIIAVIQLSWLGGIWYLGASKNPQKLVGLIPFSALVFIVIVLLPEGLIVRVRNATVWMLAHPRIYLTVLSILFIALCFYYADNQRLWTFDEEQNFKASNIVAAQGVSGLFSRYQEVSWLARQHPPLIPILNGFIMSFLGRELIVMRAISILFGLGTLLVTFAIGKMLFNQSSGLLSALLLLCFPLIVRLSSAGLLDMQQTFLFALSVLIFLLLVSRPSWALAILLGLVFGAGLLTKYSMFLAIPVMIAMGLINKNFVGKIRYLVLAGIISALIYAGWLIQANQIGLNPPGNGVVSLVAQRINGLESSLGNDLANDTIQGSQGSELQSPQPLNIRLGWFIVSAEGWRILANIFLTQLPSAIGPYNFPVLLLGMWMIIRRRSASDWILLVWLLVFSAILVLTLPDHRYFLAIFPALAIIMGIWLHNNPQVRERTLLLIICYWLCSLYLFVDWERAGPLFSS